MSAAVVWMDRVLYPNHQQNWDDSLFRSRILKHIDASTTVLDYGAGRGNVEQMNFRGIAKRMYGIDPEPAVFENPYLDEASVLDLSTGRIPFPDEMFDVVFADNVMEHVDNPETVLREIARILKPGGLFLAKTPNKWHYMPVIARLTPTWFHRAYNKRRGRKVIDTFPTRYRCNTASSIKNHAASAGLIVRDISLIEGRPEYLRILAPTYLIGWIWERIVNSFSVLTGLRCVIVMELQRPNAKN